MANTIDELLHDNDFEYNPKGGPVYNYHAFQQAISFKHGVEFLKTSNFSNKPVLFLLKVPILSINLSDAEKTLKNFNQKLLNQLNKYIDRSRNQFDMFVHYYELYRAVLLQQEDYKESKEEFFASASALKFNIKDIKDQKLPVIRTYYKSLFQDMFRDTLEPIEIDKIGTDGIKHLGKLYLLRRRYNKNLLNELEILRRKLFRDKTFVNYYKYTGDIADLQEIAISLARSGNLECLDGRSISESQFPKDFSLFLGRTFSTVQGNKPTIDRRIARRESFFHRAINTLKS